jgi:hypothetical protein
MFQTAQEVKIDLLFLFGTPQNHTFFLLQFGRGTLLNIFHRIATSFPSVIPQDPVILSGSEGSPVSIPKL